MERLTDKIASLPPSSTFFSLEFFPPKTPAGTTNLLPRLHRLARLRPLFVTVTWGAGGSTSAKSLELAEITQRQLGLTTCLHLTCTNMRRSVLDAALDECVRIGVRNILALRGDEPRKGEYGDGEWTNGHTGEDVNGKHDDDEPQFGYAIDLVRYIRARHGAHFCIGVAAYPEGHAASSYPTAQSAELDLPHLVAKTAAGADFIMTQLFYDVEAFLRFEKMLRGHESGVFKDIPIIPGLMPIHSWQILTRTTKLSCARLPEEIRGRLEGIKADDEVVKREGVKILSEIVRTIKDAGTENETATKRAKGFHFYTLNLEKAVAQILESCALITPDDDSDDSSDAENSSVLLTDASLPPTNGAKLPRRRHSSFSNRVVVTAPSGQPSYEEPQSEAGIPLRASSSKTDTLAVSEGRTSLGREATWDDFPNGRWGDARSPAYGTIDGYGPNLHVHATEALRLWGTPRSRADITALFRAYLAGALPALPWSDDPLSPETQAIRAPLLALTARGCWTMASQPAVDAVPSAHEVFGWGPTRGGWVWQKPFVEFFVPAARWHVLRARLDALADDGQQVTYFAGNARGETAASEPDSVNPVTWGAFRGKEIVTPTIIEGVSFRAWTDEAFSIWREWERVFEVGSESARLMAEVRSDVWLVNVIGHEFRSEGRLWEILLDDGGDEEEGVA